MNLIHQPALLKSILFPVFVLLFSGESSGYEKFSQMKTTSGGFSGRGSSCLNHTRKSKPNNITLLGTNLMVLNADGTTNLADGNRVIFDDQYSNTVDGNDALKLNNDGESFGLLRNNQSLAIEARSTVKTTDTLYYNMSGLREMNYQLMFIPIDMPASGLKAELIDRYAQVRTPVSLLETSYFNFSVNGDAASNASNRFILVFRNEGSATLPVSIVTFTANRNRYNKVSAEWKTENEINISRYELERSINGRNFEKSMSFSLKQIVAPMQHTVVRMNLRFKELISIG